VPILSSRDLDETFAFYQRLGFERLTEAAAADTALSISRGEIELQFQHTPGIDPFSNGATAYIRVPHPDQLHSEWEVIGVQLDRATGSRLVPPVDTDGGGREFALIDLSGNVVRFGNFQTALE
jgi:catechol 2,3-dioxygenase-like lactoylglutathione lyase family enzyme